MGGPNAKETHSMTCLRWDFLKGGINSETRWKEGAGGVVGRPVGQRRCSPSRDMPTERHFLKRHCWQRFRLMRTMEQFSFFRHLLYWMFCWMLRRKKPWKDGTASERLWPGQVPVPGGMRSRASALNPTLPHLAALTGVHAVVEARGDVPAHFTQQHHAVQLCGKREAAGEREG